jgi:hypothetical protein
VQFGNGIVNDFIAQFSVKLYIATIPAPFIVALTPVCPPQLFGHVLKDTSPFTQRKQKNKKVQTYVIPNIIYTINSILFIRN